jgi:nucleoside-diphosphate-sugar epimerase
MAHPLAEDLDHILKHTTGLWDDLRGGRVFITGGTGFFGCWLLESLAWANDHLGLGVSAVVLTRDPGPMAKKAPHLAAHPAVKFHTGDVRSFEFPEGRFTHVIHAAAESATNLNDVDPAAMFDVIVQGTRRTLDFARKCGARSFLLVSSGAVYGRQPPEITHISEDYTGAPDPSLPPSAYGEGKRAAEMLCSLYARKWGIEARIARCFAFVGPYMAFDSHFAVGNFIRDGLRGGPIVVNGDGTPLRSYLYAADLAIWLWTVLLRGQTSRPYNVGSESEISIGELARTVAGVIPRETAVRIMKEAVPGEPPARYVPSTRRARLELRLTRTLDLAESLRRTAAWCLKSYRS